MAALALFTVFAAPLAADAKPDKPFKAQMTGTDNVSVDPTACPGTLQLSSITGTGNATHLGLFAVTLDTCPVFDGSGFVFAGGTFTATAADGSQLFGTVEGEVRFTPTLGVVTIEGEYEITGGTGRFDANTSGSGTFAGTETALDATLTLFAVTLTLDGTLNP